jgi:signal transduction histidine kinase
VQLIALAITVLGILLAGLISWWLAKFIARPIETEISERKRAERAVRSLNETLEQRVIERTAELREAQEELLKKQRLAVMGQTIGTVGHELKNPLAAVRNSLFMIGDLGREADVDLSRPLSRVERSVKRCENIIAELLDYTRIADLKLEPTAFDNWLDEVLRDQPTPAGIAVEYDLQAGGIELPLDDDRFRRVVINLYDNACQAMAQNNAQDACLGIRTAAVGDALEIRFCDTGPGMTQDVLDQIFEPLFTTKTTGVGLGLPAVRQIVEQHGGTIEFVSAVGEGTTALVRLPLRHQVEAAA